MKQAGDAGLGRLPLTERTGTFQSKEPRSVSIAFIFTEQILPDIMSAEEKQAAAKQTFVFPAVLMSKRPMKSDKKR